MPSGGSYGFDDLLVYTYILFCDFPEVLARYREQFRYVLVDEYQDTNYAQHSIVLQLTKENQRVCVVGDDAQSIYSFVERILIISFISRRFILTRKSLNWSRIIVLRKPLSVLPTV